MTGGKGGGVGVSRTHRATVPVVCSPRASETETVRTQLLQAPAGRLDGVNEAEGLEASWIQEPSQVALQL
jgi:hypothetical protein